MNETFLRFTVSHHCFPNGNEVFLMLFAGKMLNSGLEAGFDVDHCRGEVVEFLVQLCVLGVVHGINL